METSYQVIHPRRALIEASRLIYEDGVLSIQGIGSDGEVAAELRFVGVLLARLADEGARLRLLSGLGGCSGFVLEDQSSELLEWLSAEGMQTRDMRHARHFVVFAGEEIIDVVAFAAPALCVTKG